MPYINLETLTEDLQERARTYALMTSQLWKSHADQVLHAICGRPEHRTLLMYQARTLRILKKYFIVKVDNKSGQVHLDKFAYSEGTITPDGWRRITNKDLMRGFKLSRKHCYQLVKDWTTGALSRGGSSRFARQTASTSKVKGGARVHRPDAPHRAWVHSSTAPVAVRQK